MKYILPLVSVAALGFIIVFSDEANLALPTILKGVSVTVFCTIFPTNLLFRLICFSPLCEKLSRPLSKSRLWKKTGLSPVYLPAVFSGLLSGIPTGASLLSGADGKNREKALALSSILSPAFLCAVLKSPSAGLLLYLNLVEVLWCVSFFLPTEKEDFKALTVKTTSFSASLSHAIQSAVTVAGAMIFFSVLLSTVPERTPPIIKEMLSALFEVGTASRVCENPITLAAALSFGGLSALSQISACLDSTSMRLYLISRFYLFFPALIFLLFPKIRILQTFFTTFFLITQIYRKNT